MAKDIGEAVKFFDNETNEEIELYVVEEVRINNINYILATDGGEDEETAYIMKEVSVSEDGEVVLEMVSDDSEMEYIGKVFEQVLDDVDLK